MKTIYYNVAALLLLATAAYAVTQGNTVTFMNNTNVVITAFCSQSNSLPCTSSQACSLTSYYPNLSVIAENKTMLFSTIGFFNYTLGVLNVTGDYPTFVNCTDGIVNGSADATFRVVVTLNESAAYEKDSNVTIRGLCTRPDGSRCTASEACALSVYNPDFSIRHNKTGMTFEADGFFKHNIGVLSITGDYFSFMNCTDGTFNKTIDATFKVVLSPDERFYLDINSTLSVLNRTIIDANATLATINKTVIEANATLATINKTVIDLNATVNLINNTVTTLNSTLLNQSNFGNYTVVQLLDEINTTKNLLKGLLEKQADLSSEEVFLITDSLVSINKIVDALNRGAITPQEATQKIQEIKKSAEPVSAKAAQQASAGGSNNSLYIIIIIFSSIMAIAMVRQSRHHAAPRSGEYNVTKTLKVKPSESIAPVIQNAKKPNNANLTEFTGFHPDRKKPNSINSHLKELKELYNDGIINKATYETTRRRLQENLGILRRNEAENPVIKKFYQQKGMRLPLIQKKYVRLVDMSSNEQKELAKVHKIIGENREKLPAKMLFALQLFTKRGRAKRKAMKVHKTLDQNYRSFSEGAIDISDYLETREKLVENLRDLNSELKELG